MHVCRSCLNLNVVTGKPTSSRFFSSASDLSGTQTLPFQSGQTRLHNDAFWQLVNRITCTPTSWLCRRFHNYQSACLIRTETYFGFWFGFMLHAQTKKQQTVRSRGTQGRKGTRKTLWGALRVLAHCPDEGEDHFPTSAAVSFFGPFTTKLREPFL